MGTWGAGVLDDDFARDLARPARPASRSERAQVAAPLEVGDCLAITCADGRTEAAVVTRHKTSPSHFAPRRWRAVHPGHPDLAVKIEVYDTGWATLWKVFPKQEG